MENRRPLIAHLRAGIRGPVVIRGGTVRELMTQAYRVRDFQISGGPDWLVTDRWNLEAHAEDVPSMDIVLQSLLEDRFQLKIHRESKDMPIYELSIAKGGAKIKLSAPPTFRRPEPGKPPEPRHLVRTSGNSLIGNAVSITNLAAALGGLLGRIVVDKTGLQGLYDLELKWEADTATSPSDDSGPSIFTAIQEQLGLKLESARGP